MRQVLFTLFLGTCAVSAWGKVLHMDSRGDAVVEVNEIGGEYKVICTFSPQTKFDSAINAKFNDAKGDSLCKKGIMRYLNAGTNDLLSISGLYSVAPVKRSGGKVRYSFAVPVSGCKVMVGAAKPKAVSKSVSKNVPVAPNVAERAQEPLAVSNSVPKLLKPTKHANRPSVMPSGAKTMTVVRTSSYMSVVKYKEVNGCRSVVSQREYRDSDFKSQQEFDRLCASEFARIRDLGEENFRAVRNFGKQ